MSAQREIRIGLDNYMLPDFSQNGHNHIYRDRKGRPICVAAYEEAGRGNFGALNPDIRVGRAIYDKLHVQVTLWRKNCEDVPTYIVNGAPGLEITQDINWLLSEHLEAFGNWEKVTVEAFKDYMFRNYQVTYSSRGEWTHISAEERMAQH